MRTALLLILLSCALPVQALRLGDITVESFLGDPLKAQMVVSDDPAEDPGRVDYMVGSELDYSRLGLVRPDIADNVTLGKPELSEGQWVVPVTTRRPLDELILDLVVVASRPGAIQSRHYPLLLDFPAAIAMPEAEPEPPPVRQVRSAPAPVTAPTGVDGSQSGPRTGARTLVVERGDTLYAIARRVRPAGASLDGVADAIFQLNPDAFINGNRNRLLAGARLTIPDDSVAATSEGRASPDVSSSSPVVPPGRASESERIRLRAPPSPDEIADSLADWLESDPSALNQSRDLVQRDLAFARTEIETFKQRNENLRERISTLERRVGDMRRLLELRAAMDGGDRQETAETAEPPSVGAAMGAELDEPAAAVPPGAQTEADSAASLSGVEPAVERPVRSRWRWIAVGIAAVGALALLWFFLRARSARREERHREEILRRYLRNPTS